MIVKIGEVAMATLLNWPQAHLKRKTGEILTKLILTRTEGRGGGMRKQKAGKGRHHRQIQQVSAKRP